jgi:hypothetical protein
MAAGIDVAFGHDCVLDLPGRPATTNFRIGG